VVKIKKQKAHHKLFSAVAVLILLAALTYFFWDSSFLVALKETIRMIFGSGDAEYIEIIDLN